MINYIDKYMQAVESGQIRVCKKVLLLFDLIKQRQERYQFDLKKANRPIEFIETFCKHSKGEWIGKPLKLELFQKAVIQMIFGFVNDEGYRVHKEVFFVVGRKNGKSALLSALALYMLIADHEGGAQVCCVASKKDQAKIVFEEARNMVAQSPYLAKHVHKRKTDLYVPLTFSSFEPLSSDSNTLDGLNLHAGIIDEIHSIKDRNIYDVTIQSMSARRQPILFIITTNGFNRDGMFDELYDRSKKVLEGTIIDDGFLPIIYELDDRKDWQNKDAWIEANPGLGTIKKVEALEDNVNKAINNPSFLPTLLTKDFNIPENSAKTWLSYDVLNNTETIDMSLFGDGVYAVGGADLSSTSDLTCATLLWPCKGKIYVKQMYFIPREVAEEKEQEDKVPYSIWAKRDFIRFTDGSKVNYSDITSWFNEMRTLGILPLAVGYDNWNAQYWTDEMKRNGYTMDIVIQGAKTMSGPMKNMYADLKDKKIIYDNNPILKWCLSNTQIEADKNDNIRPIKGKGQRQRIDGTVSLIDAYVEYERNYETLRNLEGD